MISSIRGRCCPSLRGIRLHVLHVEVAEQLAARFEFDVETLQHAEPKLASLSMATTRACGRSCVA